MKLIRGALIGGALLAAAASPSFAQSSGYTGPNGPYVRLEGGDSLPTNQSVTVSGAPTNGSGTITRNNGYVVGGAGGYKFGHWRLEGDVDYSENGVKSLSSSFGNSGLTGTTSNLALMVNGYYDIGNWWNFVPYVGVGIGATDYAYNHLSTTTNTAVANGHSMQFAYQPIVGIQYLINTNWSVGAEYRYFASTDPSVSYSPGGKIKASNAEHHFLASLTFHFASPPVPPPATPVVAAPPAPPPAVMAPKKQMFIVFFEFDKSSLTPDGKKVVDAAAAAYKSGKSDVAVAGYTDLAGTQKYNLALSKRRADTVKAALVKDGVPVSAIGESWFGKEHPRVPTADGVREPQNRRVEITM
jgi:OmpA-OmpF porin, OOP family